MSFATTHDGLPAKLLAGGLSCMFISTIVNPMDVVKVVLQFQSQLKSIEHFVRDVFRHPSRSLYDHCRYRGTWDALKSIYVVEGFARGLMKGITPSMLREATYSSLRMGLYDSVKILLVSCRTKKEEFTLGQKLIAGVGSRTLGSFIATPTDEGENPFSILFAAKS